jgi:hypothetical protein
MGKLHFLWILGFTMSISSSMKLVHGQDDDFPNEIPRITTGSCLAAGLCCKGRDSKWLCFTCNTTEKISHSISTLVVVSFVEFCSIILSHYCMGIFISLHFSRFVCSAEGSTEFDHRGSRRCSVLLWPRMRTLEWLLLGFQNRLWRWAHQ